MTKISPLLALPALIVAGCNAGAPNVAQAPNPTPASVSAAPKPTEPTLEYRLAKFCRVCDMEHGKHGEEFLPTRLDKTMNGKKYRFCANICREKFDKNPKKYLVKSE